jgi:hypothetical protein
MIVKRRVRKRILWIAGIVTFVTILIMIIIKLTPVAPVEEIRVAGDVISKAGKDNAALYSKKMYNEAKVYYDSAMAIWERENEKFIFFRNYDSSVMYARLSSEKAAQAAEYSRSSISHLKTKIKERIDSLNSLLNKNNDLFNSYPLSAELRNRISSGKLLLNEAETAFASGEFLVADRKISDSEYLLLDAYKKSARMLEEYFTEYAKWQKWIRRTINESTKNRDYSIIVDKVSRKIYCYYNGSVKHTFDAELGRNWIGGKRMRGDYATPEGMYRITKKLDAGKTKYYKALLLNYPNDEDMQNFRKEKAKGDLPASAKIGGLIEIHGNGGKGTDWTEGCVALTDREMDIIFKVAKVGTPVTIVGSTVDLQKVLKR